MVHLEVQANSCRVTFSTMNQCQHLIDSSVRHWHSASITAQFASTSGFTRSCVNIILICCQSFFNQHQDQRWSSTKASQSSRSSRHSSSRQRSSHLTSKVLIRWHHHIKNIAVRSSNTIRVKPHNQVSCDQLQVISIREAQQSASSHHSFKFTTDQVLE